MYVLDISTGSRALLSNSNLSCTCPVSKLDGVRTTTVEKADAGTLCQCPGSSVFPLYMKQQLSERSLCNNGEFTPAGVPRCDVTYTVFHCILMERSIVQQTVYNVWACVLHLWGISSSLVPRMCEGIDHSLAV